MESMTRRGFMGTAAAGTVALAAGASGIPLIEVANADEAAGADESAGSVVPEEFLGQMDLPWSGRGSADGSWLGTPAELEALGGSNMPLEEVNRRRKAYVDAQTDYTCSDGTVIPAVYVKCRALLNTYGYGIGNEPNDHMCAAFMAELSEDEAQAYLDMPWGVRFTVDDFSQHSGRSFEECEQYCEDIFRKGYLNRAVTDNGTYYGQVGFSMRMVNYHQPGTMIDTDVVGYMFAPNGLFASDEQQLAYVNAGTPWFSPLPVSADVVKDGQIYPDDDIERLFATKNKFAVAPCACRGVGLYQAGGMPDTYPESYDGLDEITTEIDNNKGYAHVETCLSIGEEAQAIIDLGAGREITREEALDIIHRSVDEGLVIHRAFSKDAECICCCERNSCLAISSWKAVSAGGSLSNSRTFQQVSHYTLEVDLDSCIQCGTCVDRCPMGAVSLGEDGYPQVSDMCFRCGQCAYACPAQARKLAPLPADQVRAYPETMFEEGNEKAAERFEHGLIW